jgi:hypothetical protein
MYEQEVERAAWWDLCHQAWAEQDPVKFLDVTMQIAQFLARKQQRLDAAYEEGQREDVAN